MSTTQEVNYLSTEKAGFIIKEVDSRFAKKTELPVNLSDLINDITFTGTREEFKAADAAGLIKEGMIVNITDDTEGQYNFEVIDGCLTVETLLAVTVENGVLTL